MRPSASLDMSRMPLKRLGIWATWSVHTDRRNLRSVPRNHFNAACHKMLTMTANQDLHESFAGLTLYLSGGSDLVQLAKALPLRPIRYDRASDNCVVNFYESGHRTIVGSTKTIKRDQVKFDASDAESIVGAFDNLLNAVSALPPDARQIWESLADRTADLGLYRTESGNCGTEYHIPAKIIHALGLAGISLCISVYNVGREDDCSDTQVEDDGSSVREDEQS